MTSVVSQSQKESFYRDGFLVLSGAVSSQRVNEARRTIYRDLGRLRRRAMEVVRGPDDDAFDRFTDAAKHTAISGNEPIFLDLFNDGGARTALEELLGMPVHPVRGCQLATNFPSEPSDDVNESGYRDRDVPFFGWVGHLDGLWNGGTRIHQHLDRSMTEAEREAWEREPATNGCVKSYPEHNVNIADFTALVGVALSDQTVEGAGNLGVLKGAHHVTEAFFRAQHEAGGPLGPDGPNWERIDGRAPNGGGLRHYPDALREAFREDAYIGTDGAIWPMPTLVKMAPGDAVIVLHGVPHSATRVETSEPRLMAYFRVSSAARVRGEAHARVEGLTDIWSEWHGMRDVVQAMRQAEP